MLLLTLAGLLLAAAPTATATASTASAPAAPEEKKICRRLVETGSLI